MTIFADLVMMAFVPAALVLFMILPARRAVLATLVIGALFLPMVEYRFEGAPAYNRFAATSLAMLVGVFIFDSGRITAFRPRLLDMPMAIWCLSPFVTSISNGLGEYDGMSAVVDQTLLWGVPYFIGRLYLGDREGLKDLAVAIVVGGLLYVPLCLYEIRMSPQLHTMFYGFHQHDFKQVYRLGGWRPTVFMQHGLAVGMFMTGASLLGMWLWYTGAVKRIMGVPMLLLVPPLVVTAILCKSLGALVLLAAGMLVLFAAAGTRSRLILVILLIPPLFYVGTRTAGGWSADNLVSTARMVDPVRAESLEFRIFHENMLIGRAMDRPILGWGRWGRNRVTDEHGRTQTVTDGLWVIAFGTMGLVGLSALYMWLLVPPGVVFVRAKAIGSAITAAPVGLAVVLVLYSIDAIFNAMLNQMWTVIAGALVSAVAISTVARARGAATGKVRSGDRVRGQLA